MSYHNIMGHLPHPLNGLYELPGFLYAEILFGVSGERHQSNVHVDRGHVVQEE